MRFYECVFIMRQDLPSQDIYKTIDDYKELVKKIGGEVVKNEYWGLRTLGYEIKKNKKGHYVFFCLKGDGTIVSKIEDNLKISESIIKYLTIRVKKIQNEPTLMVQILNEKKDK